MKLYEINAEIQELLDKAIDLETGEVIDTEAFNRFEFLEMEQEEKALDIACYIKDLLAEAEAVAGERKRLQEREGVLIRRAERLKQYLAATIGSEVKYKDARAVISWRRSESVDVESIESLPPEFKRIKIEPDKQSIKEALKNGDLISGCQLVEKQNIQIR